MTSPLSFRVGNRILHLVQVYVLHVSLSFTSGTTPVNILVASMAAEPFSSIYLPAGIGGAPYRDLSRCRRVNGVSYVICRTNERCSQLNLSHGGGGN